MNKSVINKPRNQVIKAILQRKIYFQSELGKKKNISNEMKDGEL